jgi:hypothetical protein
VEVVSHQTKAQNFNQVQGGVTPDQIQHKILFNITQGKAV